MELNELCKKIRESNIHPEKVGLIGYIDLLGYRELLRQNTAKEAFEKVYDIFSKLRTNLDTIGKIFPPFRTVLTLSNKKGYEFKEDLEFEKRFTHTIFSDTIIIFCDLSDTSLESDNFGTGLMQMYWRLRVVMEDLFQSGFPSRGVMTYGKYLFSDKVGQIMFSGKCITDAHDLAGSLEAACCVVSPELAYIAEDKFSEHFEPILKTAQCIIEDVPTKVGPIKVPILKTFCEQIPDPLPYSYQKFSEHKKEVKGNALIKAQNTAKIIEMFERARNNKIEKIKKFKESCKS